MSEASNVRRNEKAIEKAFGRLTQSKDRVIRAGMVKLLPEAVKTAISMHDHSHFGHRITGDSYGWAVVHNGVITDISVNEGHHGHGDATHQLEMQAGLVEGEWVGIVLASMAVENERGKTIMLQIEYEEDLIAITEDEVISNFNKYFKRVK